MSNIDKIIKGYTDSGRLHGVAAIVVDKNGKEIYSGAHGNIKVGAVDSPKMALDTVCFMASQTKLMTSVACMKLVEDGLIGLDDDVGKFVPHLANMDILQSIGEDQKPVLVKAKGKMTLRLLLSHSSGLAYDISSPDLQAWAAFHNRKENTFSGSIAGYTHPLLFEPGTDWSYGCGIDWAGQVVEAISKKTLGEFMQENIWTPLGMKDTTFHPELREDFTARSMEIAVRAGTDGSLIAMPNPYSNPAETDCGGIGSYSTAQDYIKFVGALLAGGGPILRPETVNELFSPQLKDNQHLMKVLSGPSRAVLAGTWPLGTEANHSLCGTLNVNEIPDKQGKGTVNWGGMANTFWWVDREKGITGTVLTQLMPPGEPAALDLLSDLHTEVYK